MLRTIVLTLVTLIRFFPCVNSRDEYDFIVVGAGAGGGAVARRLVETGNYSVLLIESGGRPKPELEIPALFGEFISDPEISFQFRSTPQQNADLLNNGVVSIGVGRMLGGTTSMNAMWFNRGHPRDWDNWSNITGDESWKYENMLKYFKRVETYNGDFPSDQHGYDGPINVSRPRYAPGLDIWLEAGRELGYPVGDPNGPQQRSFTPVEFAKRNGRRVSAYTGYLRPIWNNPNLHIRMNTNVTQVLFEGNRAVGVRYISNATSDTDSDVAYARKEVILSAGTYNSALILQRSGIGPRDVLRAANISVFKELPTGVNFQDHQLISLNFIINNASLVMDQQRDLTPQNWEFFNNFGDGPYSNTNGATGQALISTSIAISEGNADWPDMQLCMSHSTTPYVYTGDEPVQQSDLNEGETHMSSSIFMGRPKSRGSVRINPNNILDHPIIDVGYLTDPRDLQMFLDAIEETLRIYEQTNTYKRLQARYFPSKLPACQKFVPKSKDYWICYLTHFLSGGCHAAGTNKMGKIGDPSAVVDSELRVIGIEGLRVVDASIMPFVVNANPHAAVYAIGEKGAEMILNQWGSASRSKSSLQDASSRKQQRKYGNNKIHQDVESSPIPKSHPRGGWSHHPNH